MLFNAPFSAIAEHHPTYHWTTLQYLHIKPDPVNTWAWELCYKHKCFHCCRGWSYTLPKVPSWGGSHPVTFHITPSHRLHYYCSYYDYVSWSPFLLKCSTAQRKYRRMKNSALAEKHTTRATGKRRAHIVTAMTINRWNNELKDVTGSPIQCSRLNLFFLKILSSLMSFKVVVSYLPSGLKRSTTNPYLLGKILRHEKLKNMESHWVTGLSISVTRSAVVSSLFHLRTPFKHNCERSIRSLTYKGLLHHLFHKAESTALVFHCPQKYESRALSWCFTRGPFTIILKIRRNCALLETATAEAAGPRAVTRGVEGGNGPVI